MHSISKYINGHSDVIMGCVMTNSKVLAERFVFLQTSTRSDSNSLPLRFLTCFRLSVVGAIPSPLDCFLVNRGIKTLHIRMEAHMKNALAVAKYLESEPRVEKVFYPGE